MPDSALPGLRVRRRALGLTQAELAERLGRSRSTVLRWERGGQTPDAPEMIELAMRQLETDRTMPAESGEEK